MNISVLNSSAKVKLSHKGIRNHLEEARRVDENSRKRFERQCSEEKRHESAELIFRADILVEIDQMETGCQLPADLIL